MNTRKVIGIDWQPSTEKENLIVAIEKLQPAEGGAVSVYQPYYQGTKRNLLPLAISLYQKASLEGNRKIEGGESIPFLATWLVSSLPADMTHCRMQFDRNVELTYEVTMANHEFIDFLIEVIINYRRSRAKETDFSQSFYRKLLRLDE